MTLKLVNILDTDRGIRERVRQWRNKEEVRKWMFNQNIISTEEHARWLENLSYVSDSKFWVAYFNDTPIGAAYLQHINVENKTTEWGFYIGEEDYRSKGLGKMILFDVLEEIFDRMGFQSVLTRVLSNNAGAIKLYAAFHFVEKQRYRTDNAQEVILLEFHDSMWSNVRNELKTMSQKLDFRHFSRIKG